jgi:hypothetical protein
VGVGVDSVGVGVDPVGVGVDVEFTVMVGLSECGRLECAAVAVGALVVSVTSVSTSVLSRYCARRSGRSGRKR